MALLMKDNIFFLSLHKPSSIIIDSTCVFDIVDCFIQIAFWLDHMQTLPPFRWRDSNLPMTSSFVNLKEIQNMKSIERGVKNLLSLIFLIPVEYLPRCSCHACFCTHHYKGCANRDTYWHKCTGTFFCEYTE